MHNHNSSSIKKNSAKRQRTYDFGDIVGLKVSDVDRTNTSSTILPCKIIDKYVRNGEFIYTVATKDGIIKEHFDSLTFLDLTTANFGSLRAINIDELPTITFIQASQIYTNFKSTETCKCFEMHRQCYGWFRRKSEYFEKLILTISFSTLKPWFALSKNFFCCKASINQLLPTFKQNELNKIK
ncbi:unnamed protein product [Rotaria sordida]|uniref:Uncharacterized protein n=1 Tax=Rotaria sordida TaxID=392033 RepID=A0A814QXC2_9BILA|nr:unnamed protein product [Rotaria sordida]